jgi:hypothetical protein
VGASRVAAPTPQIERFSEQIEKGSYLGISATPLAPSEEESDSE